MSIKDVVAEYNTLVKDGMPSPRELWETLPGPRLLAPPPYILGHLALARTVVPLEVTDDGILYDKVRYGPNVKAENADDMIQRFMNMKGRMVDVHVLDMGDYGNMLVADFDGEHVEILPLNAKHNKMSTHRRMELRGRVIKREKGERKRQLEGYRTLLAEKHGKKILIDSVTRKPIIRPITEANSPQAGAQQSTPDQPDKTLPVTEMIPKQSDDASASPSIEAIVPAVHEEQQPLDLIEPAVATAVAISEEHLEENPSDKAHQPPTEDFMDRLQRRRARYHHQG